MDRKKKIITAIGGGVFAALLGGFIWYLFNSSSSKSYGQSKISIDIPKVDENKIRRNSKINDYERENAKKGESNKSVRSLLDFDGFGQDNSEIDSLNTIEGGGLFEDRLSRLSKKDAIKKSLSMEDIQQNPNSEDQSSALLKELMELQDQQQSLQNDPYMDPSEIEAILREYNQSISGNGPNDIPSYLNNATNGLLGDDPIRDDKGAVQEKALDLKSAVGNYFQGAGALNSNNKIRDLIPIETVDDDILVNGSTIALRTKKDMKLNDPAIHIPKGSIVYGRVTISTDRLMIDIESYKSGLKLYMLDFVVYDFDGREGVHLGNRTWPKIPSKVTKDVYEYAYQRGTQAATFGGETNIDLDQAKDIAILSAAKNIGSEVFDKRKVLMPKKYYLWFNVQTN